MDPIQNLRENFFENIKKFNFKLVEQMTLPKDDFKFLTYIFSLDENKLFLKRFNSLNALETKNCSSDIASSYENVYKNRYRNIIPYDHNLVNITMEDLFTPNKINSSDIQDNDKVNTNSEDTQQEDTYNLSEIVEPKIALPAKERKLSDILGLNFDSLVEFQDKRTQIDPEGYINASFIQGFKYPNEYISTQAPIKSTIPDFYKMLWKFDVKTVVMLTRYEESGRIKSDYYLPGLMSFFDKNVTLNDDGFIDLKNGLYIRHVTSENIKSIIVTTVAIRAYKKYKSEENESSYVEKTFKHFFFESWPDFDIPDNLINFYDLVYIVQKWQDSSRSPICVHCSAGVGRSGTYIAIDYLYKKLDSGCKMIDIDKYILRMRESRCQMVMTPSQYKFIHEMVVMKLLFMTKPIPTYSYNECFTDFKNYLESISSEEVIKKSKDSREALIEKLKKFGERVFNSRTQQISNIISDKSISSQILDLSSKKTNKNENVENEPTIHTSDTNENIKTNQQQDINLDYENYKPSSLLGTKSVEILNKENEKSDESNSTEDTVVITQKEPIVEHDEIEDLTAKEPNDTLKIIEDSSTHKIEESETKYQEELNTEENTQSQENIVSSNSITDRNDESINTQNNIHEDACENADNSIVIVDLDTPSLALYYFPNTFNKITNVENKDIPLSYQELIPIIEPNMFFTSVVTTKSWENLIFCNDPNENNTSEFINYLLKENICDVGYYGIADKCQFDNKNINFLSNIPKIELKFLSNPIILDDASNITTQELKIEGNGILKQFNYTKFYIPNSNSDIEFKSMKFCNPNILATKDSVKFLKNIYFTLMKCKEDQTKLLIHTNCKFYLKMILVSLIVFEIIDYVKEVSIPKKVKKTLGYEKINKKPSNEKINKRASNEKINKKYSNENIHKKASSEKLRRAASDEKSKILKSKFSNISVDKINIETDKKMDIINDKTDNRDNIKEKTNNIVPKTDIKKILSQKLAISLSSSDNDIMPNLNQEKSQDDNIKLFSTNISSLKNLEESFLSKIIDDEIKTDIKYSNSEDIDLLGKKFASINEELTEMVLSDTGCSSFDKADSTTFEKELDDNKHNEELELLDKENENKSNKKLILQNSSNLENDDNSYMKVAPPRLSSLDKSKLHELAKKLSSSDKKELEELAKKINENSTHNLKILAVRLSSSDETELNRLNKKLSNNESNKLREIAKKLSAQDKLDLKKIAKKLSSETIDVSMAREKFSSSGDVDSYKIVEKYENYDILLEKKDSKSIINDEYLKKPELSYESNIEKSIVALSEQSQGVNNLKTEVIDDSSKLCESENLPTDQLSSNQSNDKNAEISTPIDIDNVTDNKKKLRKKRSQQGKRYKKKKIVYEPEIDYDDSITEMTSKKYNPLNIAVIIYYLRSYDPTLVKNKNEYKQIVSFIDRLISML